jgi:hypothetical protein
LPPSLHKNRKFSSTGMQAPPSLDGWPYSTPASPVTAVKAEATVIDPPAFALLSPPSSPRTFKSAQARPSRHAIPSHRSKPSGLGSPHRTRPYSRQGRVQVNTMSDSSYESWSPSGMKASASKTHSNSGGRQSSEGVRSYSLADAMLPHVGFVFFFRSDKNCSHRLYRKQPPQPRSSSRRPTQGSQMPSSRMPSSSLTGAIGDSQISSNVHRSGTPHPEGQTPYAMDPNASILWTPGQTQPGQSAYTTVPVQSGGIPYQAFSPAPSVSGTSGPYVQYQEYPQTAFHHASGSVPEGSPSYGSASYSDPALFSHTRTVMQRSTVSGGSAVSASSFADPSASTSMASPLMATSPQRGPASSERDENRSLRRRIQEMELTHQSLCERIQFLESELQSAGLSQWSTPPTGASGSADVTRTGRSSLLSALTPHSAPFKASWKSRTEARIRKFCSLNRAGNALCAWHDSRRERRAYPPRMAPPNHLNCGCTYEEALFEESLARHGIGSYHPGESVRMDPALRNPLLKLLQRRYEYQDGDFERDPITGGWVQGEGPQVWEQRLAVAGTSHSRKPRSEEQR